MSRKLTEMIKPNALAPLRQAEIQASMPAIVAGTAGAAAFGSRSAMLCAAGCCPSAAGCGGNFRCRSMRGLPRVLPPFPAVPPKPSPLI